MKGLAYEKICLTSSLDQWARGMPFSTMGSQTSFNGGGWIDLIKFIVGGLIWKNMQNEGTGI
jgi:hypothetical protein